MRAYPKEFMISHMPKAVPEPSLHDPTSFVIFGATGDLSQRKLLPALYHLYRKKLLPSQLKIVGVSRDQLNHESYRTFVHRTIMAALPNEDTSLLDKFCQLFLFHSGLFEDGQLYLKLSEEL